MKLFKKISHLSKKKKSDISMTSELLVQWPFHAFRSPAGPEVMDGRLLKCYFLSLTKRSYSLS